MWVKSDHQGDNEATMLNALMLTTKFAPAEHGDWVNFDILKNISFG